MSRTKVLAALAGLVSMVVAVFVAMPATAATSTVFSVNFEDGTTGPWTQSGGGAATLSYVTDGSQALAVARTADYVGIQSPQGAFVAGTTYSFSMRVRLADGTDGTAAIRFVGKPGYSWIGNTTGVSSSGWTTVSGEWTVPADADTAATQVYIGSGDLSGGGTAYTYLVDDLLVTTEVADACVPETTSLSGSDFEDATPGDWTQSGGGASTLSYVTDGSQAVAIARTADYVGLQSPVGIFEAGTTYTISAKVKLAADTEGTIAARFVMKPAYDWIANTPNISSAGWTTVTGEYTVPAGADTSALQLYIGTADLSGGGTAYTYLVDDLSVTYQSECTDGPEPGTVAISTGFEDGLDGWGARDNGTGAPTVAVTTADAHSGAQSALVSDRTSQGSGVRYNVTDALVAGTTYELTAWIKFAQSPTEDVWLSLENHNGDATTFSTLAQFTGMSAGEWQQVTATFAMPTTDEAYLYFETAYEGGDTGNTSSFMVDDISVVVPEPPVVQDITPMKDTLPFPIGVAIDSRETTGASSDLLLKHFDQVTPENYMKPEAWYDAEGNFSPSPEIDTLMDYAQANDLRVYGHVLVWHSQTPDWFFQHEDGTWLTNSDADKAVLRARMHDHINNVAEYLSDNWGEFGSATNPIVAFDVVNEVVDDSSAYADGLRRSRWYSVLGEEYIDDAFAYANDAFNGTYADAGATHPVTLFINDYNTEQGGKQARYHALVERMQSRSVPVDGVGHQFHVSLSMPVSTLGAALDAFEDTGLKQAVTEFDVTTGTPVTQAKLIDQGYYYRDAFRTFRDHADDIFSVTVWGLIDSRSWRDSSGAPLIFDDGLQAKPAYDGVIDDDSLPAPLRTANVFAGDVAIGAESGSSPEWDRLPLLPAGDDAQFQLRWAADHLTAYVTVADATADATDAVSFSVDDETYTVGRDGEGDVDAKVTATSGGYSVVAHLPVAAALGDTVPFDVRVTNGTDTDGWNSPGVLGTLTLVEELSHVDVPEAALAPVIDAAKDPVWSTSSQAETTKQVSGSNGAVGTFHLLWKGQTLYVYAEVADPTVDVSGSDPWTQDSVEIYVDSGNAKNGSYRYDDTQIRINADNTVSFGTGDEAYQAARVNSATARVDGGYVVEAAISLLEYGGLGSHQGLDVQVNDATGGARTAIRNWADPTGAGYQSTARWGVATLVEGTPIQQSSFTPVVKGTTTVGSTLSVKGLPTGTSLGYQWLRNGAPISGATKSTYKLTTADGGSRLSVRVTSVLAGYADRVETSAKTAVVLKTFSKVTTPTISGTAAVGHTLKAKVAAWSPSASYRYQWFSNGKAIHGATGSTFKLTRSQAGTKVSVKVTGSRTGYVSVTKSSATKSVPLLKFTVGPSWLNGPTRVGGVLKVTPGASRPVATVKTYKWYANGKVVAGATKATYVVKSGDLGKRITAKVTFKAKGYATKVVEVGPTFRISRAR